MTCFGHKSVPVRCSNPLEEKRQDVQANTKTVGRETRAGPRKTFFRESEVQFLGGGFKHFYFHPYLGKVPILTHIFQMG